MYIERTETDIPLDLDLQDAWLSEYRADQEACGSGVWVDPPFAADWAADASGWDARRAAYIAPISGLRLGPVAILFHPGELFSFYGLQLRHNELFRHTLVIGYTDDFVGYLTDPNSFERDEYAAVVVPKLMGLPPFRRHAARHVTAELERLIASLAS